MRLKSKQVQILLVLSCFIGIFSILTIYNKADQVNYFQLLLSKKNFPIISIVPSSKIKILNDYFSSSSFGKIIQYKHNINIMTHPYDIGFSVKLKKDIEKIMYNNSFLNVHDTNQGEKLFQPFMRPILDILHLNINDTNSSITHARADLEFYPKVFLGFNPNSDLSSKSFINFSDENKLLNYLQVQPENFIDSIIDSKIPSNGNTYQYLGGVISIQTGDNSNSHLLKQKNQIKIKNGKINYRRFFRINRLSDLDLKVSLPDFKIDMTHFKSTVAGYSKIITVDVLENYLNYDAALSELRFSFNLETFPSLTDGISNKKELGNNSLYIIGSNKFTKFKVKVKSLIWSFQQENFTSKSNIIIELINPQFNMNYGELKKNIRNQILLKHAPDIIRSLKLSRFHSSLEFKN